MERWHATTSSDTPANHGAHLPDERSGHAPFPRRPQQRGVDRARTPNLTTLRGGQNGRKQQEERERDYSFYWCLPGIALIFWHHTPAVNERVLPLHVHLIIFCSELFKKYGIQRVWSFTFFVFCFILNLLPLFFFNCCVKAFLPLICITANKNKNWFNVLIMFVWNSIAFIAWTSGCRHSYCHLSKKTHTKPHKNLTFLTKNVGKSAEILYIYHSNCQPLKNTGNWFVTQSRCVNEHYEFKFVSGQY